MPLAQSLSELTGPVYGHDAVDALDSDLFLTAQKNGVPLGERIIVAGRVMDEDARPLIEVVREQTDLPLNWAALGDPANYLGSADRLIDRALAAAPGAGK